MGIEMYKLSQKLLFTVCCIFITTSIYTQKVNWTGQENFLLIGEQVSILKDVDGNLTIEEVSASKYRDQFIPSEKKILNFEVEEAFFWVRFSLNNSTEDKLLLEVAQSLVPDIDFYYQDPQGAWQSIHSGYTVNLHQKFLQHHFQLFPINSANGEYYIRLKNCSISLPLKIWEKKEYEVKKIRQKIIYGIYMGIMIFVILNNIFLFFSLRKVGYLHYCLLVFLYASFSSIIDGYLTYLVPEIDLLYWYFLNPIINQPNGLFYCIFFLEVSKYDPKIKKFAWAVAIYFTIYIFVYSYLPFMKIVVINQLNALFGILLMATLGIRAGRRGNRLGYYFALAYFIFFVIASIEVIYAQTGSPAYLFELSHVSIGILVEVFLLSYLLSKRFEWEKKDIENARLAAQQKVIEKTKENERIIQESNIILEQKVIKRTEQLQQSNQDLQVAFEVAEKEREKSDDLLLNILPATTALELKEKGVAQSRTYESVSVLFTDFKGFTKSTENILPDKLVNNLNHCFIAFDKIVQKHNIEKIKTIGDAYMAAGGLPIQNNTHAIDTIKAAIEMQAFITQWKERQAAIGEVAWDVRIGIHSGQVISGVVGMHKFSYDIWGDTVNVASRMEENSEAGKINISAATYQLAKDQIDYIPRGEIEVKGKGKMEMYFVKGLK